MFRFVIQSLILIFSYGNFIYSQSCDLILKGEITDLHDNSLLIGAFVSIQGTNFFSQTDLDGSYKIKGLCHGKYNLVISHPKCISINKKLNIKQSRVYNLELEHHINELDEIIVTDSKISKLRKSIQEVSLNISDINSYGSNTLVEALNYIPGASILKTGNSIGKPIIHGMYGSRVGIITDDFRQYDQQWGPDHAPNIDFDSFDIILFYIN